MDQQIKALILSKIASLEAEVLNLKKKTSYSKEIELKLILVETLKEQVSNENTRYTAR